MSFGKVRGGGCGRKMKHFNANDRCFGRELKIGTSRPRERANHLFAMSNLRSLNAFIYQLLHNRIV
jgi:hypothetical protein